MPRLFVHNLPFKATEEEVIAALQDFGEVTFVRIINDRETGRSKGYGFIDIEPLPQYEGGLIDAMQGTPMGGRRLNIAPANDRGSSKPAEAPRQPFIKDGDNGHRNGGKGKKKSKGGSGKRRRGTDNWD